VLGDPVMSSTQYREQTAVGLGIDGTTFTIVNDESDISEPVSLQSSEDQQTPLITTKLAETVVTDGEKNFSWKFVSYQISFLTEIFIFDHDFYFWPPAKNAFLTM